MPFCAAASAVTWAANGVDLREPLKPALPADSHAITAPSRSVSVTIVLLNDVLMCACPNGMFFRTRRRPPARLRGADLACGISAYRLSSSGRPDRGAGPCGHARWSSSAARAPAGPGDDEARGR